MIKRFIPERTPEELEQRLKLLKHGSKGAGHRLSLPRIGMPPKKAFIIIGTIVAALAAIGSALALVPSQAPKQPPDTLPQSVVNQLSGFTPYYFKPSFQTDFTLQRNSVQFQSGVLLFNMQNPAGQTLTFTEEATPPGYDTSSLQTDKNYTNGFGQVFISDGALRTTGALFSNNHTWILINAPKPVGADLMQQVIDNLEPISH